MNYKRTYFFVLFLISFLIGCGSIPNYHKSSLNPKYVLLANLRDKDKKYAYVYFTHKKALGNPSRAHLVLDNCRYAGIFYSDTFIVVKLLPGNHNLRIMYPPSIYDLRNKRYFNEANPGGNRVLIIFRNVQGGETYAYDFETTWHSGMSPKPIKNLAELIDLPVSSGCVDCEKDPTSEETFANNCSFPPGNLDLGNGTEITDENIPAYFEHLKSKK